MKGTEHFKQTIKEYLDGRAQTDDEVWSLAIHYYDEDNIDVGNPISCGVVVNHVLCQS